MVRRTARRGPSAGSGFWGCSRYPSCRGTRSIDAPASASPRATPGSKTTSGRPRLGAARRPTPPTTRQDSREHALLRYYIDCIESEGTRELVMKAGGQGERFFLIDSGEESVITGEAGDWRPLSDDPAVASWATRRAMASRSERLLFGYPLVAGSSDGDRSYAPLFYGEVQLRVDGGVTMIRPENALVELSLFALDLLGVDRQERGAIMESVESIDEPQDAHGLFSVKLQLLADLGVIPLEELNFLDPAALTPVADDEGIANCGMVFVGERALVTRQLIEDLEELSNEDPESLRKGPLGVLLGAHEARLAPSPSPQPAIVPTNLSQDRAITSALEREFTVVTGPPGTGKSQVLVNTVAAALEQGETVLFASKNNQAVDVVFERMAAVSPEASPLRVGAARLRSTTAQAIRQALSRSTTKSASLASSRREWAELSSELAPLYRLESGRVEAERALATAEERHSQMADRLSPVMLLIDEPGAIETAAAKLDRARLASDAPIRWPFFRAKKRTATKQAFEQAWRALLNGLPEPLAAEYPADTPTERVPEITRELKDACDVARQAAAVREARQTLEALPDRWEVQESIRERDDDRTRIARLLFESRWVQKIRAAEASVRSTAGTYADGLENLSRGKGGSAARLRDTVEGTLGMFPIWGVTNLSARTNLPLKSALFDLVVIDEASQCDIASALPLLFRAKRALIIGDRNQLIHVSTLPASQDALLAKHHSLSDADALSMGYRATSLFGLAARRVGEDPIFLEEHYRSHRAIITFSNDLFYGSRLIVLTDGAKPLDGPAVRWVDAPGVFAKGPRGSSVVNRPEVETVVETLQRFTPQPELSVGVVSPYRAQVEAIRAALARLRPIEGLTVDTAHRFQGDERDLMVFSPTVCASMPPHYAKFANDPNLVNVSVTRARRQLWIVGDRDACQALGGVLGHLATYASDLADGRFESPIERRLYEALAQQGTRPQPGLEVGGYRLDLAIQLDDLKLDVECDGAAFHQDRRQDAIRDTQLRDAGWEVIRLSGRQINNDLEQCVRAVLEALGDRDR